MSYTPKPLQIQKAKKLGLTIEPSKKRIRKLMLNLKMVAY